MENKGEDTSESWEKIYQEGSPGWNVGYVTPAIKDLHEKYKDDWFNSGHIIIPGCGYGHEVEYFLNQGFKVTAIDFAPSAINEIRKRLMPNANLTLIEKDLFLIGENELCQGDFILEHTCFCAIPIQNRDKYVAFVDKFLKAKGVFLGLFYKFNAEEGSGPPHPISDEIIRNLFEEKFVIEHLSVSEKSHPKRLGHEKSFIMRRK